MIANKTQNLISAIVRKLAILLFYLISFFVYITKGNKTLIKFKFVIGVFLLSYNASNLNAQIKPAKNLTDTIRIDVTLEEDQVKLEDVVVTCYMGHIRPDYFEFKGGKDELEKYIRNNLNIPQIVSKDNINDTVNVQLSFNDYGAIINAEIVKSVNEECDNEALRLIKKMPKWLPKNDNKNNNQQRRPIISIIFNSNELKN